MADATALVTDDATTVVVHWKSALSPRLPGRRAVIRSDDLDALLERINFMIVPGSVWIEQAAA